MNLQKLLRVGAKLTVFSPPKSEIVYQAYLEAFTEEGPAISVPQKTGQRLVLHYGDPVRVRFQIGGSQSVEFRTTVVGESKSHLILAAPEAISKVQQREAVRFPIVIEVECSIGEPDARTVKMDTVDISAGGLCLRAGSSIAEGTEIWMTIPMVRQNKKRLINAEGVVIRSIVLEHRYGLEHQWALGFTKINRADQDFIVGFIFEQMAKQRPKL